MSWVTEAQFLPKELFSAQNCSLKFFRADCDSIIEMSARVMGNQYSIDFREEPEK